MNELTPAERKHRLADALDGLKEADATIGRAAWRWGMLLKDIADNELWRESEATSFSGFCDSALTISRRAAGRAMALFVHFSEEMAGTFGAARLNYALDYMELTDKLEKPGDILALEVRFRGPDGKFTSVKFPKAKLAQLRDACRVLRESAAAKLEKEERAAFDADVRAQITSIEADLPAAPPGTVRGRRVVLRKGRDGSVAVDVKGIPLAELLEFQAWKKSKGGP